MTVKELRRLLADKSDDSAYMSTYSTLGIILPCLLLEDIADEKEIDEHPNRPAFCY